jgi:hypothetical protein
VRLDHLLSKESIPHRWGSNDRPVHGQLVGALACSSNVIDVVVGLALPRRDRTAYYLLFRFEGVGATDSLRRVGRPLRTAEQARASLHGGFPRAPPRELSFGVESRWSDRRRVLVTLRRSHRDSERPERTDVAPCGRLLDVRGCTGVELPCEFISKLLRANGGCLGAKNR